jgi:hypothetical protein
MRARHRHFNPAHAGFALALDSRFLPLNNNDLVSTWTGRTGTNLSPTASGAIRPTFLTNVLNGNPAIRFGGSQYFLNTTESFSGPKSIIAVAANRRSSLSGTAVDAVAAAGWGGNAAVGAWVPNSFNGFSSATQRRVSFGSSNRKNGGTSINLNLNEYFIGSGYLSQTITVTGFEIGAHRNNAGNLDFTTIGDILLVAVIKSQASSELTKRLEHAAAYSFKISCN